MGKAGQTKFLTLDGSEPREGGRVPSPNLEDVSPPVKARRGLHSDAVFEIWVWKRGRRVQVCEEEALQTSGTLGRLPGLSGSGHSGCVLGAATLHSCLEAFNKESVVDPHHSR